ncbi:hypothetical protein C8R42DRAFT_10993 [Lentinula raphanica]|nr:hypothetical protein C8R42DRAFT_10993 [Lentinula raphanica]
MSCWSQQWFEPPFSDISSYPSVYERPCRRIGSFDGIVLGMIEEDTGDVDKSNGHASIHTKNPVQELAFRERQKITSMRQREGNDQSAPIGGCSQAVEILTRNSMRFSYNVNKDGIEIAVSTFIESAFRLGYSRSCRAQ